MITVLKRKLPNSNVVDINEYNKLLGEGAFENPIKVDTDSFEIAFMKAESFMGDVMIDSNDIVYAVTFCGFRKLYS